MTEDEIIADLRDKLPPAGKIREVRMFGGTGFMLNGNMVAGTFRKGLLLRVGAERQAQALKFGAAQQMEMGGRLMEGYVHIDPKSLTAKTMEAALRLAIAFVGTLPPKKTPARKKAK